MAEYNLKTTLNSRKIFLVKHSELEDRWDSFFFLNKIEFLNSFKYPLVKVKNYFIIKDGDHDKLPEDELSDEFNGKRYLRAQDLKDGKILDQKPIYISKKYFDKISRCHIYPNDLLVSIMASLGLNAIVPDNYPICTANRAIGILRNKTNDHLLTQYLQILIDTNVGFKLFEIEKKGGIQQRLNLSDLGNVKIPIPPKEIQEQIVNIYNTAYSKKQAKENKAKDLLTSIDKYLLKELGISLPQKDNSLNSRIIITKFREITGKRLDVYYNDSYYGRLLKNIENSNYTVTNLNELIYSVSGVIYTRADESTNGIKILRGNNITLENNELNFDSIRFLRNDFQVSDSLKLKTEDILLSTASGSKEHVGKVVFIENDLDYYFGGFMSVFRKLKTSNHNQKYLFEFLQSAIFRLYLQRFLGGTNINNINLNMIGNIPIPLPPIQKQNEIALYIHNIRLQSKVLQESSLEVLESAKRKIEQIILQE